MNSLIADWKHQAESKHIVDKASLSSLVQDWISNAEYILFDLQVCSDSIIVLSFVFTDFCVKTTKAIVELKPLSCAVCALLVTGGL